MTEKKASQSQQDGFGSNGSTNPWQQAAEAQAARVQSFYDQLAQYESEGATRALQAVDEMTRLTKEAIEHSARLASEWRRLSLEAMRRSADLASRTGL